MRILILSWEYPPRLYGGLGRHVDALSRALVAAGHEVHVVSNGTADAPASEVRRGVQVHRVAPAPPQPPEGEWATEVLAANSGLLAAASDVLRHAPVDVLHAHDWLVAYTAAGLRAAFDVPLVATVHATEAGRHQGWLPGPMNRFIHDVEWWLTTEARRVIVCSRAMRTQVRDLFDVPGDRVDRIENGVDIDEFRAIDADAVTATRSRVAQPGEHLVIAAGRLEYEKGIHVLIRAVRRLRRAGVPARLALAGTGTYETELRALAQRLRVSHAVTFLGFLDRPALAALYGAADAVAVPSIYEPFGITALEAMASGTPLVAGRTGGLAEVIDDGRTGLLTKPGDTPELTAALRVVLTQPTRARRLAVSAREHAAWYDWARIAERTVAVYERAVSEERPLASPVSLPTSTFQAKEPPWPR